ncbi:universal stress protein [Marinihelvus fidelis]|uniref:Universal stress protein n=1 Tax=Marinihelvus fidelis TaxID=2613842 RepID=A0A5N0T5X3_9GAMM|nr:universal stress protein [Marinihelvus fidelis]KAA9129547.1 universal stress protein [Marinihelvus fidelis]
MSATHLVGVDCSDCSDRALDYAIERARDSGADLLVAHVIEWSRYSFSTAAENEQRHKRREEELARARTEVIDPVVAKIREAGIEARGVIRHGHAAETLAKLAKDNDTASIIVGRAGSSRFKAQFFGSVASSLVQIADRPVTVVP